MCFLKFVSAKCPGCSADLTLSDDGAFLVCAYCGTKILRPEESASAAAERAELIRAETERIETLNRIEKEKAEREAGEQRAFFGMLEETLRKLSGIVTGLVLFAIVFFCIMGTLGNAEKWIFAAVTTIVLYLLWSRRGRRLIRRLSKTVTVLILLVLFFAVIMGAMGKLDDLILSVLQYLRGT